MSRAILFLDFDGVLHGLDSNLEGVFSRLPLLEEMLRELPSVDVVVSSAWREVMGLPELQGLFAEDIQSRVIGATPLGIRDPTIGQRYGPYERQAECAAWMARSGVPGRPWLALDDMADLFEPGFAQLVAVDGQEGLTDSAITELKAALARLLAQKDGGS